MALVTIKLWKLAKYFLPRAHAQGVIGLSIDMVCPSVVVVVNTKMA